jgi:Spy/CpxP family protein refolding chaperone
MKVAPQAAPSAATKEMMKDEFNKAVDSLHLTGDQKTKLHGILGDAKTQRESIFKDSSLTDEQKQEKLKDLRTSTRSKIDDALTPEQRTQLTDKLKAAAAKSKSMQ